jgi:hypothetical protein
MTAPGGLFFIHHAGGCAAAGALRTFDIDLLRSVFSFDPTTGCLTRKDTGREFGSLHASGYRRGTFNGRTINAHRLAYAIALGEWPPQIDHANGIRHDNRLCNLRGVTKAENAKNTASPRNTSGVCGVMFNKKLGKWQAYISRDKRRVHLGVFSDIGAAAAARKVAERECGYGPTHGRLTNFRDTIHAGSL